MIIKEVVFLFLMSVLCSCAGGQESRDLGCVSPRVLTGKYSQADFECFLLGLRNNDYLMDRKEIDEEPVYQFFLDNSFEKSINGSVLTLLEYKSDTQAANDLYALEAYVNYISYAGFKAGGRTVSNVKTLFDACVDSPRKDYLAAKVIYIKDHDFGLFLRSIFSSSRIADEEGCSVASDIYESLIFPKDSLHYIARLEVIDSLQINLDSLCTQRPLISKLLYYRLVDDPSLKAYAEELEEENYFLALASKYIMLDYYLESDDDDAMMAIVADLDTSFTLIQGDGYNYDFLVYGRMLEVRLAYFFKHQQYSAMVDAIKHAKPNPYLYWKEEKFTDKFFNLLSYLLERYDTPEVQALGESEFVTKYFCDILPCEAIKQR